MAKKKIIFIIIIMLILIYCIYSPINIATESIETQALSEEWVETGFIDPTSSEEAIGEKKIDSIIYNSKLYIATKISIYGEEVVTNKIYVQAYDGKSWTNVGEPIISEAQSTVVEQISFCNIENKGLYIFYISEEKLEFSKLNDNTNEWEKVGEPLDEASSQFEIVTKKGNTYITAINSNQTVAKVYKFDGIQISELFVYKENDGYIGEPKVAILNELVYISIKEAGKETISLYEYNPYSEQIKEVENCQVTAYTYNMVTVSENVKDKLYIAAVTSNETDMVIHTYDGSVWGEIKTGLQFETHTPNMIVKEGDLYILALVVNGKLQTYTHNKNNNTFQKEGNDVDVAAETAQALAYEDNIYTIYITNETNEIKVKRKAYIRNIIKGDINLDGRVNIQDVLLGIQALVGMKELSPKQTEAGHVTTKYDYFNINDILRICQFLVGNIEAL